MRTATTFTLASLFCLAAMARAQEPNGPGEGDLIRAAQQETDPGKKIKILDTWTQSYPESNYKVDRLSMRLQTYQRMGTADQMYAAAKELKDIAPANPAALYYLTSLPPGMAITTPERLAETEQNAAALQAAIPTIFRNRPPNVDQAALETQRHAFERQVLRTKAWVASQQKDEAKLEALYRNQLQKDPNDAESSYALGTAILALRQKDRQPEAMYHIGRAAYYDGPNALDARTRPVVQSFFEKNMTSYTGSREAALAFANQAKSAPFPPPGFYLMSQFDHHLVEERCTQFHSRSRFARFTNFFTHNWPKLQCRPESVSADFAKVRGSSVTNLDFKRAAR